MAPTDFVPARLTVDMFRLPKLAPIEIRTRVVREGLRIKVVEAEFVSGGVAMARASCQFLRKTENPPGKVWEPPNWDVPRPSEIPVPTDPRLGMNGKWITRPIVGAMGTVGPRRLWMSEARDLVEGTPLTPFVRVAVGARFRQPVRQCRRSGARLHQQRRHALSPPLAGHEWVGFEVVNHHATDGIAIGECWLYDEMGAIGTSTVAALAQRKPMAAPRPPTVKAFAVRSA